MYCTVFIINGTDQMKCRSAFQGAHCVSVGVLTSAHISHPLTSWRFGDWLIYGH